MAFSIALYCDYTGAFALCAAPKQMKVPSKSQTNGLVVLTHLCAELSVHCKQSSWRLSQSWFLPFLELLMMCFAASAVTRKKKKKCVFVSFLQRDYGGPLVCQDGEIRVVVGVSVHGRGCARANQPGIFINVPFYTQWIHKVFKYYPNPE